MRRSLVLLLGLLGPYAAVSGAASDRPSLLLVTLDTTRADVLGPYGGPPAATPTVGRLAASGTRFASAFAVAPVTLPAHASLFTGLYPPRHGIRDNGRFLLGEEATTLAEVLSAAGYRTAAFVSAAVLERRFGLDQGFDVYDDDLSSGRPRALRMIAERRGEDTVARARAWLEETGDETRPFFLWVHLFDPHAAYEAPPEFEHRFPGNPYLAEIAYTDAMLGRLLEHPRLRRSEALLTVVVADHGEALGEHGEATHGMLAYDSTLHVPFLLAGAGVPEGRVVADPVSQVDLLPTVAALLDVAAPADLDGRSLVALLTGGDAGLPDLYAETLVPAFNYGWSELRVSRRGPWKLIDGSEPELYHVDLDPAEQRDLIDERPEMAALLRQALPVEGADRATTAPLDPAFRRRLEALGYLGASAAPARRGAPPGPAALIGVHETLGRAKQLLLERRLAEAERLLDEARRADRDNLEVARLSADLALLRGDWPRARQLAATVLRAAPGADSVLRAARVEEATGDPAAALEILASFPEDHPESLDVLAERARLEAECGDPARARRLLEAVLERAPDEPRYQLAWAELVDLPRGAFAEGLRRAEMAARLEPFLGHAWAVVGTLEEALGRDADAAKTYRRGLDHQPEDPELQAVLGMLLQRRGDTAQALPLLLSAVQAQPRPAAAHLLALGEALHDSERSEEATRAFERAAAADTGAASATNVARARALQRLGRWEEAQPIWLALRDQPRHAATAAEGLAAVAGAKGAWSDCESWARTAVAEDRAAAGAWNQLAVCLEEQDRAPAALAAYDAALAAQPSFWAARFNRGLLQRQLGHYAEARDDLETVLAVVPDHAKSHYELGLVLGGALGDPRGARDHLRRALELEPEHPRARHIRSLLAELDSAGP